jgi:hypothetical protein
MSARPIIRYARLANHPSRHSAVALIAFLLPSFKPVIKGYQWRVVAHYVLHFESIKPNEP